MRAHPLQSNVNPSAAPPLSLSLNQQSIYSRSTEVPMCMRMRLGRVRVHTNDKIINEHKTVPAQERQRPESETTV